MTEPRLELASWALDAEIEACIDVREEDSVRFDWWRATCWVHDWYTTGSKPIVEDAAAEHVASEHPPCGALAPAPGADGPLRCYLQPGHGDDHMGRGGTWPQAPDRPTARRPGGGRPMSLRKETGNDRRWRRFFTGPLGWLWTCHICRLEATWPMATLEDGYAEAIDHLEEEHLRTERT